MRLCEVYTSVQGEGPNTGKPITFVRFGGCNLRCPGWGTGKLPDGTVVQGCDTVFAVYPEWKESWTKVGPEDVRTLIPESPKHVCLTGGEPLIQRSSELKDLVWKLAGDNYSIDLFTNGTVSLGKHTWTSLDQVTVIMDWKLPGSGEGSSFDVGNLSRLGSKDAIKFVVKDRHDFDIALEHIKWAENKGILAMEVWFGPVWSEMDPAELAEWVQLEYPEGHLNIQTHKYIWPADARRV